MPKLLLERRLAAAGVSPADHPGHSRHFIIDPFLETAHTETGVGIFESFISIPLLLPHSLQFKDIFIYIKIMVMMISHS